MRLSTSSILILATAALTIPIIEFDRKTNGTILPLLAKRSPLLKLDNSVDFDALDSHVELVDAKTLRGLENYERNTGMSHSLAVKGTGLQDLKKRAVGAAPLTSRNGLVWYTTVTIGNPPQSFTVAVDTGSSDLFIPGPNCLLCSDNSFWDPASSSTSQAKGSVFATHFGDGVIATGRQYTDKVIIARLSADVQTIGAATAYSAKFGYPPDGMLGMAFQSMSSYPASPLFETLVTEGKVTQPMFSLRLTSYGGELYLGGTNPNLYHGEIIYTPVTVAGYWQVNIQEIQGDRQTKLRGIAAIIDTGSNVIVGDQSQVSDLHMSLGGSSIGNGYWSYPCDNFPTIGFNFGGGGIFEIPTRILNMGPIRTGSPDCFCGIVGRGNRAYWNLGAVFLQSVYTVLDFGNQMVGFATTMGY